MRKTWLIFSQAVTVMVAALFVVATLKPEWLSRANWSATSHGATLGPITFLQADNDGNEPGAAPDSYAPAARHATPAVVSISTSKSARNRGSGDSDDPWFRFFFGDPGDQPEQEGLGSGVVVSPQGYILTNNHVIEAADEIKVALTDGRQADATVVGTDPDTDLALLKIDLDRLPTITLGNSDKLQVGDVVLAIGNPFGVGQTVTSGIVSALGRNQLGINTFENFIQTDAAINPGNSGGALVNTHGDLVGINTAIYSRTGGSLGIGFAIPTSTAKLVMESLLKDGKVIRGWIGVEPQDLTPELAETAGAAVKDGVIITGVLNNGPAAQAGIRPGDIVRRIGGTSVSSTTQLLNTVAALPPGRAVGIDIVRGRDELSVQVTPTQRPTQQQLRRQPQ